MFERTNGSHLAVLRSRLAEERLASYDTAAGGAGAESLALYEWNTELASAVFASLQGFEVVLRNALHRELTDRHARLRLPGEWYDDPGHVLDVKRHDDIREARRRIRRLNRTVTPGRVVSELSLGFWRYLLAARYEQTLWVPALRHAFPLLKPQRRRDVADRVARLHLVRNRLAHHEPIHRRDIAADYADLLFVASAICPTAGAWIDQTSTVTEVVARRPVGRAA